MKISVFYHHVRMAAEQQGVSLEEMMRRVKALGIDYLEMDLEVADRIEETAELLRRTGLQVSNVCVFYPWAKDPDYMLDDVQIRMAKDFVSDKIICVYRFPNHHFGGTVIIPRSESLPSHRFESLREENSVA